jgi:nucleoside-diphosphate-sugar epimerase
MPILDAVAAAGAAWQRLSGRPVLLSRQKLLELKQAYWVCDASKANRELGFVTRVPLRTGLELTARWYRENGWL